MTSRVFAAKHWTLDWHEQNKGVGLTEFAPKLCSSLAILSLSLTEALIPSICVPSRSVVSYRYTTPSSFAFCATIGSLVAVSMVSKSSVASFVTGGGAEIT